MPQIVLVRLTAAFSGPHTHTENIIAQTGWWITLSIVGSTVQPAGPQGEIRANVTTLRGHLQGFPENRRRNQFRKNTQENDMAGPGGYPTPEDDGIHLEHRKTLVERMQDLGEGVLFRTGDISHTAGEADDISRMRGYDYIHVVDGYCVAIVETPYLRRAPRRALMLESYKRLAACNLVETGDRIAWRMRLKPWEPLAGYRYYTDGDPAVLSFGHMKIRILRGASWLLDESDPARLFRALVDLTDKEYAIAMQRRENTARISDEQMEEAIEWARERHMSSGITVSDPEAVLSAMMSDMTDKNIPTAPRQKTPITTPRAHEKDSS